MLNMIDAIYRKILMREKGALFQMRADFVRALCLLASGMVAILFIYDYFFLPGSKADAWIVLFIFPFAYFLHPYIGWWAGWVFITQLIILSTAYRNFLVTNGYVQLLSAYLLTTMLAGYIYGVRGIFVASVVQTLALWYWNIYLTGTSLELWQVVPAFISATIWIVMFAYSEYTRSILIEDVRSRASDINNAYHDTLVSLADALELRDNDTYEHSERVSHLTVEVASRLGFSGESLENVQRGAILHDLGKLGIPDAILRKPGPLDPDEWEVMKTHPDLAVHIVRNVSFLVPALPILQSHHERWDGSGYPDGLIGDAIPLEARIFAVVDVYDALISDRPYHSAMSHQEAIDFLYANAGILFDPAIIPVFEEVVDAYYRYLDLENEDQLQ